MKLKMKISHLALRYIGRICFVFEENGERQVMFVDSDHQDVYTNFLYGL